jgi:hypothetical protein
MNEAACCRWLRGVNETRLCELVRNGDMCRMRPRGIAPELICWFGELDWSHTVALDSRGGLRTPDSPRSS